MSKIDLSKYGITGTTEVVYNPSYEQLFEEETKPTLEGYEKGQESELGAVNVIIRTLLPSLRGICSFPHPRWPRTYPTANACTSLPRPLQTT